MAATVSVGRFATLTHLSVKTLRHYHEVGLLEPAYVDGSSGYRYYSLDQLPTAQLIRRLRDLRMPIAEVRAVLVTRDPGERNILIGAHLDRLEVELAETRVAVSSLRALLDTARTRGPITRRRELSFSAISISDIVDPDDVLSWWEGALAELRSFAHERGVQPSGPAGGIFDETLYHQEPARATVYVPVPATPDTDGRIRGMQIAEADVVTTTHHGSEADIDLAYADLGSYLSDHDIHVGHQIREHYIRDRSHTPDQAQWETEIAWPVG